MSIFIITKPVLIIYFVLPKNQSGNSDFAGFIFIIDIFYPKGEPISQQSLRCSPFEVVHYIFKGHCLAFAATSARE